MGYRADVDGLRAVAVLSVVLFHADVPFVTGGFVGVDVFFVISGYLITAILVSPAGRLRSDLGTFYLRRTRRILPVLLAVCAATLFAAYLLYTPSELRDLCVSLLHALFFAANFHYVGVTGYFHGLNIGDPLLHTWSLAVEEQLYLLYPLGLWLLARMVPSLVRWALPAGLLLSFLACLWATSEHGFAAYFWMPFRAWEFLLGAVLSVKLLPELTHRVWREAAASLGLLAIVLACTAIDRSTAFPGWAALLPSGGALLVIWAGARGSLVTALLSWRPLVGLGLISYSLYLWHWPILSLGRRVADLGSDGPALWIALTFCLLLSVLSWRYLEQPLRRGAVLSRPSRFLAASAAATLILACLAFAGERTVGWSGRYPALADFYGTYGDIRLEERFREGSCFLRRGQGPGELDRASCLPASGRPVLFLWGDSHAAQLNGALRRALAGRGHDMAQVTAAACPPLLGLEVPARPDCEAFNAMALERLMQTSPSGVVLAGDWRRAEALPGFDEAFRATLAALRAAGAEVAVLGQAPVFAGSVLRQVEKGYMRGYPPTNLRALDYRALNERLGALASEYGSGFADPYRLLCEGLACTVFVEEQLLFFDDNHLTEEGARFLIARSFPLFHLHLGGAQDEP